HVDIAEVQTAEGKLYLYVAIDRTSKFAFVQLVRKTGRTSAAAFLEALIAAVPYNIHTVLTDNGIQFTFPPRYADGPTARYATHMFDLCCQENGIEHRLTKIKHPWTNGQVERMNRTIKEATVQRYHYDRHDQLEAHLADFINAYNYARRLKTLKGLTPYEYICKCWTSQPERFRLNPLQKMPGLNNLEQLAITQEQMAQNIAALQAAEQDIRKKISSRPLAQTISDQPRKPPKPPANSSPGQSPPAPPPPPVAQSPSQSRSGSP